MKSDLDRGYLTKIEETKAEPKRIPLPPPGKFEREKSGNYELIFPFNSKSGELSSSLNRQQGTSKSMTGPNYMKMLVDEIKKYSLEYTAFVKNNRTYATSSS